MQEEDKSSYLRAFFRFFIGFHFMAACSLLLFCAAVYFVINSVSSRQSFMHEAVWDKQFNAENLDTKFVTISDHYEVNLSLWRSVPYTLRGTKVSPVRQIVSRKVVRKAGQEEYLLAMHTSGLKPDFTCLTHPFTFTKDYGLVKPQGASNLSRFTAWVDISKEPVGEPIDVNFIIHSWNAYQGDKNQMFGAYVKPETQTLSFHMVMPAPLDRFAFSFERIAATGGEALPMTRQQLNYRVVDVKEFHISTDNPRVGDLYIIRWKRQGDDAK